MALVVTKSMFPVLKALAGGIDRALQDELKAERPRMQRKILKVLEKFALARFKMQRDPLGRFWKRPAPMTINLRKQSGFSGKKAGITASKKMMNSFKVGKAGNVARVQGWKIFYGSKLRRAGHVVAEVFSSEHNFFSALAGRSVRHPARRIIQWTPKIDEQVREILMEGLRKSLTRALRKTARKASRRA